MGFMDRLSSLFGGGARLVDYPEEYRSVEVPTLRVHTANFSPDTEETLVIITLASLDPLSLLDAPLRLTSGSERPVTFVPVRTPNDPALDPTLGWIIPVTPETAAEIEALPPGPGAHALSTLHVGLVIEEA
ncbi:hypothetical protein SAMN04488539_1342 [Corynebacterium timonense]|uniref:Uncharacterized protein n=2 Tax=Corynebacterium timonense TaxID=441500 RepID=A0A1H1QUA8_9CORY|nr:hypothetical protein SAMN04488539_1342 [Corynebacterium timonense]